MLPVTPPEHLRDQAMAHYQGQARASYELARSALGRQNLPEFHSIMNGIISDIEMLKVEMDKSLREQAAHNGWEVL